MAFNRTLWVEKFSRADVPEFVCPACKKGVLKGDQKTIDTQEPHYSKAAHKMDDWEPDWITERFMMFLKCTLPTCGEQVAVSGDTQIAEVMLEDDEWGWEQMLRPQAVFPAPPIIF